VDASATLPRTIACSSLPARSGRHYSNTGKCSGELWSVTYHGIDRPILYCWHNHLLPQRQEKQPALKKLTLLGTVRKSRTELPIQLLLKKREQYESIFMFTENILLVSYAPQKNRTAILMSTMHDQPEVDTVNEERKPFAVLDYNCTKGAVDSFDQQIGYYSCARKTNRWPMRLFYFIIDAACFNSSVIFRMSNDAWKENEGRRRDQRRLFLLTLGSKWLCQQYTIRVNEYYALCFAGHINFVNDSTNAANRRNVEFSSRRIGNTEE
jgi:hypothetical protein